MIANKDNKPRSMGNCEMCYYFEESEKALNDRYGFCHRFPGDLQIKKDHYCGEFVMKTVSPWGGSGVEEWAK